MGRPPSPDSYLIPHPHISSPFVKLGISLLLLMGLIFTTSVLGSHPALRNAVRMRELICCAPVTSLLAARSGIHALFRPERASKTDPTEKGQTVCPSRRSVRQRVYQSSVTAHVRTKWTCALFLQCSGRLELPKCGYHTLYYLFCDSGIPYMHNTITNTK